jgi:hypothetical protein
MYTSPGQLGSNCPGATMHGDQEIHGRNVCAQCDHDIHGLCVCAHATANHLAIESKYEDANWHYVGHRTWIAVSSRCAQRDWPELS